MCKCEQTSDLNIALRDAYSQTTEILKYVVWESKNNEIFIGVEKKAQKRLKDGTIECYFLPKKIDNQISFDIIEKPPLTEQRVNKK